MYLLQWESLSRVLSFNSLKIRLRLFILRFSGNHSHLILKYHFKIHDSNNLFLFSHDSWRMMSPFLLRSHTTSTSSNIYVLPPEDGERRALAGIKSSFETLEDHARKQFGANARARFGKRGWFVKRSTLTEQNRREADKIRPVVLTAVWRVNVAGLVSFLSSVYRMFFELSPP